MKCNLRLLRQPFSIFHSPSSNSRQLFFSTPMLLWKAIPFFCTLHSIMLLLFGLKLSVFISEKESEHLSPSWDMNSALKDIKQENNLPNKRPICFSEIHQSVFLSSFKQHQRILDMKSATESVQHYYSNIKSTLIIFNNGHYHLYRLNVAAHIYSSGKN